VGSVFEFADPKQQRIYGKLNELVGPGPAAFFKDACWMMSNPKSLECTVNFVGHCMREIESALRDVLRPFQELTDEDLSPADSSSGHKREIQQILRSLEIPENDGTAKAWFELVGNLHKLAHRRALEPPRGLEEVQELWEKFQNLLDIVLAKIENKFLVYFSVLDQLLTIKQPTKKHIKRLMNEIPHNFVTHRYFFDRLENPEWIEPLRKRGLFRKPPHPIREGGRVRFLQWPEAKYLARMAKHKPELVAGIILEMEDTENAVVLEDLVDAALAMPPDISVRLVEKVKKWAEVPYFFLPEKIGELMAHWARGNKVQEAMGLARTLLDVFPEKGLGVKRARFEDWLYEQILKDHYPELVKAAGLPALELLCELLEKAIQFSPHREEGAEDFSYTWRPAIEDHPQNLGHTVKDALVSAVRDASELLVKSGQASIEEVAETLGRRKWKVFRRIALHLLRLFPKQAQALIVARLTDRDLLEDVGVQHEYALLLRENFPRLPEDEKRKILSWIEEGPRDPAEQREQWQLRRLAWIGYENLPADWQKKYQELISKYGEPKHPEYWVSWVGPTSPKTAEELKAMSVEEIVEFLSSWEPPTVGFFGPSREGLGRVLQEVVAEDPQRFAIEAERFIGLDPTYVRAIISGLEGAIGRQKNFEWSPVLKLCRWVVEQPREIPGRKVEMMEADPDWGWTRKAIAHLFLTAFEGDKGNIPFELREEIWEILKTLTDDPNPTPKEEERYRGSTMDPATLSINTVRGTAMHAVVQYALWVRRHLEKQPNATERVSRGFDEMPEVREVLESHLDTNRDPSLAIRSVYGRWFPWLVLLDRNWAEKWKAQIFPLDAENKEYFDAAWNTYIIFCRPYDDVFQAFQILRDVYAHAIDQIGQHEVRFRYLTDPNGGLAEHLMAFYWRGKVDLKDPLFVSFWEKAPDPLRAHAIEFIGRSLKYTDESIPSEIIERLKELWEERFSQVKKDSVKHEREVAAFGWWFVSGKFDVDWSITMLSEALKLVPKTEPADMVIEQLSEIAETYSLESIECLRRIAEGDKEGWLLYTNEEAIRKVLQSGLANPNTRKRTEEFINYLGRRGFLSYRDLLG